MRERSLGGAPWVLKLDTYGNVVWQKFYVVAYPSNGARSVRQTTDGGYIVAGYTNAYYFHGGMSLGDVWVLKLDAVGNVVWQRKYGLHMQEEAYSVQLTPDGGYVVAGFTDVSPGYPPVRRALLLKLDAAGSVVWSKSFGRGGQDEARFVQVTADGGYIVAGLAGAFRAEDAWVLKLDGNGAINGCAIAAGEVAVGADTLATTASSTVNAVDTNAAPTSGKYSPTDSASMVLEQCRYE